MCVVGDTGGQGAHRGHHPRAAGGAHCLMGHQVINTRMRKQRHLSAPPKKAPHQQNHKIALLCCLNCLNSLT